MGIHGWGGRPAGAAAGRDGTPPHSLEDARLQNAAYLLEGDLRWAQQIAVANAGAGPQAELCLRADGYDVYTTAYAGGDPLNINPAAYAAVAGSRVKSVHRGEEYAAGIQIAPPPAGTVACTADPARVAVAFRASGQPLFTDAELEYARQLGWEGLCVPAAGQTACTDYVPSTDCTGAAAQGAPLSEGPAQPPELPYGRIVVSWDPHTPSDSTGTQYLQLVEVDVYRTQAD
jgi:hypothetical protein